MSIAVIEDNCNNEGMQVGHRLQFPCTACREAIGFSVLDLSDKLTCDGCGREYVFDDPDLVRQLGKFEALCKQIADSDEILSDAAVGVRVGQEEVKVPLRLLLTRLNSMITLQIDGEEIEIRFRIEPGREKV